MPKKNELRGISEIGKACVHTLIAAFAFLFLEIACLFHERYIRITCGNRHKKVAYLYRW